MGSLLGTEEARDIEDVDDVDDNIEEMYLTFAVHGSEYAVCLTHVTEIVVGQNIIPVPDVPQFITGVINLRGRVIPVMDVRCRFGLSRQEHHERVGIVVVEVDGTSTGLAVDEVKDVLQIGAAEIAPPVGQQGRTSSIIKGIGKRGDAISFILDVGRLLDMGAQVGVETAQNVTLRGSEGEP